MKCGVVAIIGLPNVGKSSLINALLGTQAVIISPKPQTTRNSVRCIYNAEDSQIVFTDTPGLYTATSHRDKLGAFLNEEILSALEDADAVLWMVEADTRKVSEQDKELAGMIPAGLPIVLAASKSDKADPSEVFRLYGELREFASTVAVSAKCKRGLNELVAVLLQLMPEGFPLYEPDILMDTTEKFMASEIIRQKVLMLLRDEVPHCVAVEIEDYKSPEEYPDRKKLYIRAALITETDGQKKIVIGRDGRTIKRISTEAREAIEEVTGQPVYLELWVKVLPHWRRNSTSLRRLGYAQ